MYYVFIKGQILISDVMDLNKILITNSQEVKTMKKHIKRPISMLLTVLMVISLFVSLPAAEIVYAEDNNVPAGGRVITWSGNTLLYAMSFHDTDNTFSGPDTNDGITVDYSGGTRNAQSGLYNTMNDNTGAVTKHIRLNKSDSELKFTSSTDNAFITRIVINFDSYYAINGENVETMSLYVNHEAWTKQDVTNSDGKHTLTLTGPAARNVTLRTGRIYSIKGINSISFYITDNLYTTPTRESGFSVKELDDNGVKIIHSNPSWPLAGVPFLVKINGKIVGFSQDDSEDTQSFTIENPVAPFSFEPIVNNTVTVTDSDEFFLAIGSSLINQVVLGDNVTLDSGFNLSRAFGINLNGHTLSCDSNAANKTINVSGSDNYTFTIGNGTVEGFDNLSVGGHAGLSINSGTYYLQNILGYTSPLDNSITLSGGEFHLSQGLSGWVITTGGTYYMPNGIGTYDMAGYISEDVKLHGGRFKLYDTFDMDTLRNVCPDGYAPFAVDEGWAEVRSHRHFYYKTLDERSDGSFYYIHRCDGCDYTVSEWTLTKEEIDTLIELNGGALNDVWQWDSKNPDTAKLKLQISEDTYNTAIAEPYNMNEAALRTLRDDGFFCGPDKSSGQETVQMNYESYNYSGNNVNISCGKGLPSGNYQFETCVGNYHNDNIYVDIPDRTPMTITAKNGRSFQKIIFHIGAYGFNAALAYVDHGDLEVSEEGATLVVTNIHSDTITLHSNNDDLFQVSSVEVIYHDSSNSYLTTVTVNTEPVAAHCDQRTASYTYRNHTYTHNFENSAVLIHNFHYDYVWELREETTVEFTDLRGKTITRTVAQPVITGVSRTCENCGLHENASGFEQQSVQTVSPTYTENGAIKFPAHAWFEDGTTHTESYNYELPHYTLVHYPTVTPTCDEYGFADVWYDQETHRCYSNAEGTNYVTTADNHLQTAVFISGKMMYLDRIDNKQQLSDQLCFYMTASADGSLQLVRLTPEQIDAMSSVTDMPADFTPVGLNDIASLTDVPDLGTLIISNNENPAQTLPIDPLGHLCNPETEVTFNWDLKETIWYVWSDELQTQLEVSGFRPCATASFICDRCGTTISKNVDGIETVNGTAPHLRQRWLERIHRLC